MGKWVVTVAGIAILSVLCDVILPEGQTRKYVKTVFGVVVSLVIISPLVQLFSSGLDVSGGESSVSSQQQYLENVSERESQYALRTVKQLLVARGIAVTSIELNSATDTLTLELGVTYSDELNKIVNEIAAAYFPKARVVCIWSRV